eukprot:1440658-Pleurochrysis_carterae.AAC.1
MHGPSGLDMTIVLDGTRSGESGEQAEKESVESTPHSPAKPIHVGEMEFLLASRRAEEGGQTEALEHLMDVPPSLPPSPPPMRL